MGVDERMRRAREARERSGFDATLASALKRGDERALPADQFGQAVHTGDLLMHFAVTPPVSQVMGIQQVLDPRAPAGMLRLVVTYELLVPAGTPIRELLVVGTAPAAEQTPAPAEPSREIEVVREPESEPAGPRLVLTDRDAH